MTNTLIWHKKFVCVIVDKNIEVSLCFILPCFALATFCHTQGIVLKMFLNALIDRVLSKNFN